MGQLRYKTLPTNQISGVIVWLSITKAHGHGCNSIKGLSPFPTLRKSMAYIHWKQLINKSSLPDLDSRKSSCETYFCFNHLILHLAYGFPLFSALFSKSCKTPIITVLQQPLTGLFMKSFKLSQIEYWWHSQWKLAIDNNFILRKQI